MIIQVFKHALMITGFVFAMMLVIEYVNVLTRGRWDSAVARWRWGQSAFASFLGATPGCLGAYAVASLYMHRVLTFGALMATMVATCGDEAFVMLALFPGQALLLFAILFVGGLVAGILTDMVLKGRRTHENPHLQAYHASHPDQPMCVSFSWGQLATQWRRCSAQRGWLMLMLALFVLGVATGEIGHQHFGPMVPEQHAEASAEPHAEHDHEAHAGHGHWDWVRTTLLAAGLFGLFVVVTVPDHFLEEHLWNHIAKVHAWRILLWTFGALVVTHYMLDKLSIGEHISANPWQVLAIACLVGIIPESGPHLIFVTLYAGGTIPFSILLANSIVQDGHGMIPILAHSRRAFCAIKLAKLAAGLSIGAIGLAMGW